MTGRGRRGAGGQAPGESDSRTGPASARPTRNPETGDFSTEGTLASRRLAELRERAEVLLKARAEGPQAVSAADIAHLFHELEVSQAELEIQNHLLREAHFDLDRARARAEELFARAPTCHLVSDAGDVILEANYAAQLQLGDSLRGRSMIQLVASSAHESFARHRRRVFDTGKRHGFEIVLRRADGSEGEFWLESVSWEEEGGARTMLSSAIDLSARKAAERALRQSEERYRTLFDHARDAILLFNHEGLLVDGNPAAAHLLGWPTDGSLSVIRMEELFSEGQAAKERLLAAAHRPGEAGPLVELEVRRSDGARLLVEASVAAPSGELLHLVLRDLTSRRRAEEERLRLEERLRARRVEAVERLAGGLAHDMNNVLATIMSLSSVLTESPGGTVARADADEILAACHHGRGLTQNLLAFARQSTMVRREFDVNAVVGEAVAAVARTIPTSVSLTLSASTAETWVGGDAGQVAQIVTNLCTNSVEAMAGGGTLRVETSRRRIDGPPGGPDRPPGTERLAARDYVRISVSDSGAGIPAEAMPYVSEPFFTTKIGRGTGLGLAIVFGCAESHDGAVHIESAPGVGTRVEVYLPALEPSGIVSAPHPITPQAVAAIPGAGAAPSAARQRRVLLVEDDPSVRKATRRLLERAGCTVVSVASGEEALAAHAEEGPFRLVVLDINMPGMDGVTCARRLFEREPSLRVLFASGWSRERIPAELLSQVNVGAIRKPFTADELARVVNEMLRR